MASSLTLINRVRSLQRLRETLAAEQPARLPSTELPGIGDVPLLELIPRLSPELERPVHLAPLVNEIELAIAPHGGQRFFWFSVPPRHYKTFTLRHGAAKHIARWPSEAVAYVTHTQTFANKQSREIRKLGKKLNWAFSRDSNRQDEWELNDGGGLVARGMDGELTGRGFRLILIDDPIKSREQANSSVEREKIFQAIEEDIVTRLSPDGTVILLHTRWHPDDPIGRYQKRRHWHGVNLPALSGEEENVALLPDVWSFEHLDTIRTSNVYKFDALYQGRPRSKGTKRFHEPAKYDWTDQLPAQAYRVAYGVDLAYSERTQARADFSVCLKMLRVDDRYYVTDVIRRQVDAPAFTLALRSAHSKDPGPMRWYASGTEKGAGQFVKEKLSSFQIRPATSDKYQRSERVSEAWNLGKVLVPGGDDRPDWVDDFLDEVTNFTGVRDDHDDQVDALAAAFDLLNQSNDGGGELIRVKSSWS